jgi:hypothetical protein
MMSTYDPGSRGNGVDEEHVRIKQENAHHIEAVRTRTVIGQATGPLIARLDRSSEEASAELTKMSSSAKRKVRDVAATALAAGSASKAQAIARRIALPVLLCLLPTTSPDEPQHGLRGGGDVRTSKDAS